MKNLESLAGTTVTLRGKANEKGHLFAVFIRTGLGRSGRATRYEPRLCHLDKPQTTRHPIPVVIEKNRVTFTVTVKQSKNNKCHTEIQRLKSFL